MSTKAEHQVSPAELDALIAELEALGRLSVEPGSSGPAAADVPLRLSLAFLRNLVAPLVAGAAPPPVHVVVVGGTNCGKSTVVNILAGEGRAGVSQQAAFTRAPAAFRVPGAAPDRWWNRPHLLESAEEAGGTPGFGVVDLTDPLGEPYLQSTVLWDTPDLDSRDSPRYRDQVLEVLGLADAVVFVASKDKYADDVLRNFLDLVLETGKPLIVVLTKFAPAEYAQAVENFTTQVVSGLRGGAPAADPVLIGYTGPPVEALWTTAHGEPARLRAVVRQQLLDSTALRRQAIRGAAGYLARHVRDILAPARRQVRVLHEWDERIAALGTSVMRDYRAKYLDNEAHADSFRIAMVHLLNLMDIPLASQVTRAIRNTMTRPIRWLWSILIGARSDKSDQRPEVRVVQEAVERQLKEIKLFLHEHQDGHPLWRQLFRRFDLDAPALQDEFNGALEEHEKRMVERIDRTARSLYTKLQENPARLALLRSGKLTAEVAGVAMAIHAGGIDLVHDLIIGPLAYAATQALVEAGAAAYVEGAKHDLRADQEQLAQRLIDDHLCRPLRDLGRRVMPVDRLSQAGVLDDLESRLQGLGQGLRLEA